MQCSCGNNMTDSTHKVKTMNKGVEWWVDAKEKDLPLTIHQQTCSACGRLSYKVISKNGKVKKIF